MLSQFEFAISFVVRSNTAVRFSADVPVLPSYRSLSASLLAKFPTPDNSRSSEFGRKTGNLKTKPSLRLRAGVFDDLRLLGNLLIRRVSTALWTLLS